MRFVSRYFARLDARLEDDDEHKTVDEMCVGAEYVSDEFTRDSSCVELSHFVQVACADPVRFYRCDRLGYAEYHYDKGELRFPSSSPSDVAANDNAYATVFEGSTRKQAIIILRHWNAGDESYGSMARILNFLGLTTVLLTLPFHGRRNRPGAVLADYFLSANLGRTIASVRQAVGDVLRTIDWLEHRGHKEFTVIGASLGSCIASMAAIADARISASALLLSAGDFAQVVWTGRATRHIRNALDGKISLPDLQAIWRIISSAPFSSILSRRNHRILMISAARDTVVLPEFAAQFASLLRRDGAQLTEYELGCGHYTLAMAPFNVLALQRIIRFIM